MTGMWVTFRGDEHLRAYLRAAPFRASEALQAGLWQEANRIMNISKETMVPVRFGVLKGSGHVQRPVVLGTQVTVTMGYGGAASEYALPVHEILTANHPVGRSKYLEAAFDQEAPLVPKHLATFVKAHLGDAL